MDRQSWKEKRPHDQNDKADRAKDATYNTPVSKDFLFLNRATQGWIVNDLSFFFKKQETKDKKND